MLPSKPRSVSSEISQKEISLGISRTISSSRHIKGNPLNSEINLKSFKSLQRKPSKITNYLPEKRIVRVSEMQQHMGQLEEELKKTKDQLGTTEAERDRAQDELREMRKVAQEASMRLSETMPVPEVYTELNEAKESLSSSSQEIKFKEKNIEFLKRELEKAQQLELRLSEKDALLNKLTEELNNVKTSEARAMGLLSESEMKIVKLEADIEKGKEVETKLYDSLASQTNQFEQTKILLEESRLEIASLSKKVQGSSDQNSRDLNVSEEGLGMEETLRNLNSKLQLAKESFSRSQEAEKLASSNAQSLLEETSLLKTELKLAIEAEEKSKKAMDDLALALKEVATEASQTKEKLGATQVELEQTKKEVEELKATLKSTEEKYKGLLDEAKKEIDCLKNTTERLRIEAEESLLAWNGKEIGFVSCIKIAEEERDAVKLQNKRLTESLVAAETMTQSSKEENHKLRDILKQALNEATVAKEAAGIAQAENSQLKDCLSEKDDALDFLTRENESLRINEYAAMENINELKRLLSEAAPNEYKLVEKELGGKLKKKTSMAKENVDGMKWGKTISFDLKELKILNEPKDNDVDEEPEIEETLKGSIFDENVESPQLAATTHHQKKSSISFTEDGEAYFSDDFEHLDGIDDMDGDRNSQKKKALLRRFGDLLRGKSFLKKEPSLE